MNKTYTTHSKDDYQNILAIRRLLERNNFILNKELTDEPDVIACYEWKDLSIFIEKTGNIDWYTDHEQKNISTTFNYYTVLGWLVENKLLGLNFKSGFGDKS